MRRIDEVIGEMEIGTPGSILEERAFIIEITAYAGRGLISQTNRAATVVKFAGVAMAEASAQVHHLMDAVDLAVDRGKRTANRKGQFVVVELSCPGISLPSPADAP